MSMPSPAVDGRAARRPPRRVDDRLMFVIMAGLLFVVGAISLARSTDTVVKAPIPAGAPVSVRDLAFMDQPDGAVLALDAQTGTGLHRFASGEGSFVRGALRSLVRARTVRALDSESIFQLTLYGDGRLILRDTETAESIDLVAFGPTNFQAFAQLLPIHDAP